MNEWCTGQHGTMPCTSQISIIITHHASCQTSLSTSGLYLRAGSLRKQREIEVRSAIPIPRSGKHNHSRLLGLCVCSLMDSQGSLCALGDISLRCTAAAQRPAVDPQEAPKHPTRCGCLRRQGCKKTSVGKKYANATAISVRLQRCMNATYGYIAHAGPK